MDDETKARWAALGERLLEISPEKFREVMRGLHDVVEAQEIIARFDHQLFFRGRPRKVYRA
jgi:hypothetical protein